MSLIMEPFSKENGQRMAIDKDKESKSGKMAANIQVTGSKIKPMARVDLFMLMEMPMKENGTTTKPKAEAPTNTWTAPSMSEIGKKINNMATA